VGSGIFSVVSKGATTNLAGSSQANGYFGAFLKFAGFDGIIVQGRAKQWSYLYIHDNTAEIRNAEGLVEKTPGRPRTPSRKIEAAEQRLFHRPCR